MADAPETIWLQRPNRDPENEWCGEVTWSDGKENEDDTEYTRSDLKPFPSAETALLATSVGRVKLAALLAEGYMVCGLAIKRGDEYGIVTDFGRVVWLSSNDQGKGPAR